jgi:hypothetical protein
VAKGGAILALRGARALESISRAMRAPAAQLSGESNRAAGLLAPDALAARATQDERVGCDPSQRCREARERRQVVHSAAARTARLDLREWRGSARFRKSVAEVVP